MVIMQNKKKNIFLMMFAGLLLSLGTPSLATANPMYLSWFPPEPITTPPIIVVQSPLEEENVNSTWAWLNFTVTEPREWFTQASDGYMPTRYLNCVRLVSYNYIRWKSKSKLSCGRQI